MYIQKVLTDDSLAECPILVLGNKIDRPGAVSENNLRTVLQIPVGLNIVQLVIIIVGLCMGPKIEL